MAKRSSNWLSSIIAVFLIAIVLFFIIYFAYPELSLKFFGIAFGKEEQVVTALQDLLVDQFGLSSDEVNRFFATEDGQELVDAVVDGTKKGADELSEVLTEENIQTIESIKQGSLNQEGVK